MKKIFSVLTLLSLLVVMVAPAVALAAATPEPIPTRGTGCTMRHELTGTDWTGLGFTCTAKGAACPFENAVGGTNTCGTCCLLDTIYTVTDWIFVGVIAIAMIMVVLGAFQIITAGGAAEKVTTGRQYILYAVIGFMVAILAKVIPGVAKSVLGM